MKNRRSTCRWRWRSSRTKMAGTVSGYYYDCYSQCGLTESACKGESSRN